MIHIYASCISIYINLHTRIRYISLQDERFLKSVFGLLASSVEVEMMSYFDYPLGVKSNNCEEF
jgi:hypothetical protein